MADVNEILTTSDLAVGYGRGAAQMRILDGLYLHMRRGEMACLLGANGAGKSTLMRTLAGELAPISGHIYINGEDIAKLSQGRRARMVGVVYANQPILARLRVIDVVGLGRMPYTGFFGSNSREDDEVVERSLRAVGMVNKAYRDITSLSDGERQKAMIARVLAQDTPLILLDEPTSYLDVASRIEIMELLGQLASQYSKTILLTTHDVAAALRVAHTAWLIDGAGCLTCGSVEDMVDSGRMNGLFAGRGVIFDSEAMDFRKDLSS